MNNIKRNWTRNHMFYSLVGAFALLLILTFVINLFFYYQEASTSEEKNQAIMKSVVHSEVSSLSDFLSNIQTDTQVLHSAPGLSAFSKDSEEREKLLSYLQTYVQSRYAFDAAAYYQEKGQTFCGFSDHRIVCTGLADAQKELNLSDSAFQTLLDEDGFVLSKGTDVRQLVTSHRIGEDIVCFRVISYGTMSSLLQLVSSEDTVFADYATSLVIEDKTGQQLCIGETSRGISADITNYPVDDTGIQFSLHIPDRTNEIIWNYVGSVIFYYGGALLICGIMMISILSARIYQPVKSVLDILPENIALDQECSEHKRIQEAILQLVRKQATAEELLYSQNSVLCQNFLHRLVLGEISDKSKVQELLEQYALSSSFDQFKIFHILTATQSSDPSEVPEDIDIPYLVSGVRLHRISSRWDSLTLLASATDDRSNFRSAAEELVRHIERVYEVSPCLIQSGIHHHVSEANAAYLEASIAAERFIDSAFTPGVYCYSDLQNQAQEHLVSTSLGMIEQQLHQALLTGHADIAEKLFAQYYTHLTESSYSTRLQRIQIVALISRLLTLPAVAERSHPAALEAELLTLLSPYLSAEEFKAQIQTLCAQIFPPTHDRNNLGSERFESILTYVHQHIFEETLCAAEVANHFGISPSSLSREFQKNTGSGFSNYIHTKRIAMARILLQQSGKAVKEIAQEVGYANSLSFTRAFRKYEGITPGAYRTTKESATG